jgi:hypothetical protein
MRGVGVFGFLINTFQLGWWFFGIIGMLQMLLAWFMPIKFRLIAILFIPSLYLILAAYCFVDASFAVSDDSYAASISGLLLVGGFFFSSPFSLIGYFLQKLKMPVTEQEHSID